MKKKLIFTMLIITAALFLGMTASADADEILTYKITNDGVMITKCDPNAEGIIRVPGQIDGKDVTRIGESAFSGCNKITELYLPDTINYIGQSAFAYCEGLYFIDVGDGPVTIMGQAFEYCLKLNVIALPKDVKTLETHYSILFATIFGDDVNVTKIYYPGSEEKLSTITGIQGKILVCNAEKRKYTFETNGGVPIEDFEYYYIPSEPKTSLEGRYFAGWYDNKELLGQPVIFPYDGESDVLYAKWSASPLDIIKPADGSELKEAIPVVKNYEYSTQIQYSGTKYYKFVPPASGEYTLKIENGVNIKGTLQNERGEVFASGQTDKDSRVLELVKELNKGEAYYISISNLEKNINIINHVLIKGNVTIDEITFSISSDAPVLNARYFEYNKNNGCIWNFELHKGNQDLSNGVLWVALYDKNKNILDFDMKTSSQDSTVCGEFAEVGAAEFYRAYWFDGELNEVSKTDFIPIQKKRVK